MRYMTGVFPFRFLKDEYVPLMRLIMRYFTCEGRFSRLFFYHIRVLMHFTRVQMMNIPFFMCRNIEKMVPLVQRKSPAQQHRSIYHYGLIQLVVIHQLAQQGIPWEEGKCRNDRNEKEYLKTTKQILATLTFSSKSTWCLYLQMKALKI